MRIKLKIWRRDGPRVWGFFESHMVEDAEPQVSLPELLDRLNGQIIENGGKPVAFELDCRKGACEACGFLVNGVPHRSLDTAPACCQYLQVFPGVARFRLEPWRSATLPIIRNLIVNCVAFDESIRAGGTVDMAAGTAPDANDVAQGHLQAKQTLDFVVRIGCGACMAACPNGAAALFVGAKLAHLLLMPQGRIEQGRQAQTMMQELDALFGPCSELGERLSACSAGIPVEAIILLNWEVPRAGLRGAARDDQGLLHKQGCVREFAPQVACSRP